MATCVLREQLIISFLFCVLHSVSGEFELTILHTNDIHARFEQTSINSAVCKEETAALGECYGGFARQYSKVKEIRGKEPNVIFLNAGDYFQGTLWYNIYKWNVTAHFANLVNHTAMALGNHEFDNGVSGLAPFLEAIKCPVVASNMDASKEPTLQGKYNKSVVVTVGGKQIGIIGYTVKGMSTMSSPGKVIFSDEIEAISEEAKRLRQEGVSIIIALGHSGIETDSRIASSVPEVDVVVGGHSHTFLYTGKPPSNDKPYKEYPVVVTQDGGKKVPIVQAYAYGKYLGNLKVKFDDDGEVTSWSGSPILLDNTVLQDPNVLADLNHWKEQVTEKGSRKIGSTHVFLDNTSGACRKGECNIGNLITDAMVDWYVNSSVPGSWGAVSFAVTNAGGIRSSVDEVSGGTITVEDIYTVAPFDNSIDVVAMKGKDVKGIFEHSVRKATPLKVQDILQVSGVHVTFNISQPEGSRVAELLIRCRDCRVPKYLPVDDEQVYWLAVNSFMYGGGGGYAIAKNARNHTKGPLSSQVLMQYMSKISPITQAIEGRTKFVPTEPLAFTSSVPSMHVTGSLSSIGVLFSFSVYFRFKF